MTEVRWPATLGFVHVNEAGDISPALADFFIPARLINLENYLSSPPTAGPGAPRAGDGASDEVGLALAALEVSDTPEEAEANRQALEELIVRLRLEEEAESRMDGRRSPGNERRLMTDHGLIWLEAR